MPDFIPRRDADLLDFCTAFTPGIVQNAQALKIAPQDVDQLAQATDAFRAAYRVAHDPGANSSVAIRTKMEARKSLVGIIRPIAAMARLFASDELRVRLGLKRRRRGKAPLLPRPESMPLLTLRRIEGRTLHMFIRDAIGRAKPRGVESAQIFSFVGERAPDDLREWQFRGTARRRYFEIDFAAPPGTKVWVTARWQNPRYETGPFCRAVYAHVGYGLGVLPGMRRPSSILPPGSATVPAAAAQELKQAA